MAKIFKGFTPDQQYTLLSKLGYSGPKDPKSMGQFIASSPNAAAKLGEYSKKAQDRINKKPAQMAEGGLAMPSGYPSSVWNTLTDAQKQAVVTQQGSSSTTPTASNTVTTTTTPTPTVPTTTSQITPSQPAPSSLDEAQQAYASALQAAVANPNDQAAQQALQTAQNNLTVQQQAFSATQVPSGTETVSQAIQTPQNLVTTAQVAKVQEQAGQFIDPATGQVGAAPTVTPAQVTEAAQAQAPDKTPTATVDATKVTPEVEQALQDAQAATAQPSKAATVAGQLEGLMAQFEGGATPPWASGAMRQAMAIMQQRGLGASSMAGQAVVQAAMESAIAIASQDAATVAQFEMQNLNNEQQMTIFKTQQRISSLFTDQAAENAAKQFNAASENQTNQFFAGLQESVSRFNADQINAIRQFNAGQENAVEQFNAQLQAQRDQFNAQNSLIIAQSNAKWRQDIATLDTAAQNQANMEAAKAATGLTANAMNQIWQRERDLMSFAFTAAQSDLDRRVQLMIADKTTEIAKLELKAQDKAGMGAVLGSVARSIFEGIF